MIDEYIFAFRVQNGPTPLDLGLLWDVSEAQIFDRGPKKFLLVFVAVGGSLMSFRLCLIYNLSDSYMRHASLIPD